MQGILLKSAVVTAREGNRYHLQVYFHLCHHKRTAHGQMILTTMAIHAWKDRVSDKTDVYIMIPSVEWKYKNVHEYMVGVGLSDKWSNYTFRPFDYTHLFSFFLVVLSWIHIPHMYVNFTFDNPEKVFLVWTICYWRSPSKQIRLVLMEWKDVKTLWIELS